MDVVQMNLNKLYDMAMKRYTQFLLKSNIAQLTSYSWILNVLHIHHYTLLKLTI